MQQKIVPNLWFNNNADEAVEFYLSAFSDGKIVSKATYPNSVEEGLAEFQLELAGKTLTVEFELLGQHFTAINAGPEFTPTPAISFMINFDPKYDDQAREHVDEAWNRLLEDGGEVLMPLDEYPYSKRYGWVKDKYGITWQLILTNPEGEDRPRVIPSLMCNDSLANRAEEAMNFYAGVFGDTKIGTVARYTQDQAPVKEGSIMFADFILENQWFSIMDAPGTHGFTFNEAISFAVYCKDQAEIDYLWGKLSAVPEAEQCGWCKDKFGLSWQIVPENIEELMKQPDAFKNMMQMRKLVIADF